MFHVGQQVQCVDIKPRSYSDPAMANLLKLRAIYTIRDIDPRTIPYVGTATVLLAEICAQRAHVPEFGWMEPGYAADRFRPLTEGKTDISIFTAMLGPKSKQPADAGT